MNNLEEFKTNLNKIPNIKLCEIVATFRYLGMMQDEATEAMVELARRRIDGDNFEFETKIEELLSLLPPIKLDLKKLFTKLPKI